MNDDDTRYLFTWNGTNLLSVKVDILLGNLTLPSLYSSDALSQYFKVRHNDDDNDADDGDKNNDVDNDNK